MKNEKKKNNPFFYKILIKKNIKKMYATKIKLNGQKKNKI